MSDAPCRPLEWEVVCSAAHAGADGAAVSSPLCPPPLEPLRIARRSAAAAFEREYVLRVLARTGGNITRAAAIAEVSRQMIQKLIRKYDL
jgi:transcriptional regulator with GAF, ATPase, and Fis domain